MQKKKSVTIPIIYLIWTSSLLFSLSLNAQIDSLAYDDRYREDQFYVGVTYNLLISKPSDASITNLSYGLQLGFIRDFPLNKTRTLALGIGVGYSFNTYFNNILATQTLGIRNYSLITEKGADNRNRIETHSIDFPLEFRWRNSTPSRYKFWRVYGGLKGSYIVGGRSKNADSSFITSFNNPDIRKFQIGASLAFGFNTWNFYAYYELLPVFETGTNLDTGESIDSKALKLGLIFYIL